MKWVNIRVPVQLLTSLLRWNLKLRVLSPISVMFFLSYIDKNDQTINQLLIFQRQAVDLGRGVYLIHQPTSPQLRLACLRRLRRKAVFASQSGCSFPKTHMCPQTNAETIEMFYLSGF
ncbi:hypothetical protein TNCV_2985811 [Trichonephila clavipes]|nr:hypothetical protein TNCV_2985811 [Trichonephila clavipes]